MIKPRFVLSLLAVFVLPGCSSILSGTSDTIGFDSNPPGAECTLVRDGSVIGNVKTPGAVVVQKTKDDIKVSCKKPGYQDATGHIASEIQGETWGNLVLGGVIGWAVDSAAGADNDYAENITVTLVPLSGAEPAAATPPPPPPVIEPQAGIGGTAPPRVWRTIDGHVQAYDGRQWIAMPASIPLTLVEQRADMGLFRYATQDGGPAQVWIGMQHVQPQ